MPSAYRRYANWTLERIRRDAAAIGPSTAALTALILESRPHPEQGYRRLHRHLAPGAALRRCAARAACGHGLEITARSYASKQSILKHGLDRHRPRPAARARPHAVPGPDRRPLDRRGAEPVIEGAGSRRQKLAGLRTRPQGKPRQSLGALPAGAVHGSAISRSLAATAATRA